MAVGGLVLEDEVIEDDEGAKERKVTREGDEKEIGVSDIHERRTSAGNGVMVLREIPASGKLGM